MLHYLHVTSEHAVIMTWLPENKGVHTGVMSSGPAPAEPLTWHFLIGLFGTGRDQIEDLRRFVVLAGV